MALSSQPHFLSPSLSSSSSSSFCHPTSKSTATQSSLSFPPNRTSKTNRDNHLRPKLLPISPKPPSPIPPQTPLQEISNPTWDPFQHQEKELDVEGEGGTAAFSNPPPFVAGNSFFRIASYGLGLFVLQTLFTVWFLSSADVDEKSRPGDSTSGTSSPPRAVDGSGTGKIGKMGGSLTVLEFDEKVSEIRVMANEARAVERKKLRNAGPGSSSVDREEDDEITTEEAASSIKTDVWKEADRRLVRLQKSLRSQSEKSLKSSNVNPKVGNPPLRRKPKSRIASTKGRGDPKGFGILKNYRSRSERDGGDLDSSGLERNVDAQDGNFEESGSAGIEEEESWWLRDEILEGIVMKVSANAQAGRDPFAGLGSEEEMNFFRALERKFEREGEAAKQWMEKKLAGIDFRNGDIQESGEERSLEGLAGPYETIQSIAQGIISGVTTKLIGRSGSRHGTSIGDIKNDRSSAEDFQKDLSVGESNMQCSDDSSRISQHTLMGTESRESESQISQNSNNRSHGTSTISRKHIPSSGNGDSEKGLQTRRVKEGKAELHRDKNDQLNVEKNSWWQKLPFVLVRDNHSVNIPFSWVRYSMGDMLEERSLSELMIQLLIFLFQKRPKIKGLRSSNPGYFWCLRKLYYLQLPRLIRTNWAIFLCRGSDNKDLRGLYSLKMNSKSDDESSTSYTVAFEGRGDATNFCYILESFFKDLGDFSAEVVPLSMEEVKAAIKSRRMKVIIVRKGQLELYAGQPLEDVERALHSLL